MNMKTEEHQRNIKMDFGMKIASHSILKEINNGCQNNLVISPLSLHIALNMLASASTGRTLQQLLHFLESENITDLNAQSSLFTELPTSGGGGPIISLVNGIWVHHRFPMKHSFKQLAENVYKAKAESVDFENKGEKVRDEINSWARDVSKGHIYPLIPLDFFKKDAIALLATAIYFNAKWVHKFNASNTNHEDFHLLNGQTISVPFMKDYGCKHIYGLFESFKLLKMEYKNGQLDSKKYAMYIFLPHQNDGLKELVDKFHSDPRFLLENREVSEVLLQKLWLPKLKYEYALNADETMKELGLDLAFDEKKAEITRMVKKTPRNKKVYLSKVIQKSYIEVDEEGTIARAITASQPCVMGVRMPPPPRPIFVADHPFLFMIKEEVSDIILFVGAALNPEKGAAKMKKRKMKATYKEENKKQKYEKNDTNRPFSAYSVVRDMFLKGRFTRKS